MQHPCFHASPLNVVVIGQNFSWKFGTSSCNLLIWLFMCPDHPWSDLKHYEVWGRTWCGFGKFLPCVLFVFNNLPKTKLRSTLQHFLCKHLVISFSCLAFSLFINFIEMDPALKTYSNPSLEYKLDFVIKCSLGFGRTILCIKIVCIMKFNVTFLYFMKSRKNKSLW